MEKNKSHSEPKAILHQASPCGSPPASPLPTHNASPEPGGPRREKPHPHTTSHSPGLLPLMTVIPVTPPRGTCRGQKWGSVSGLGLGGGGGEPKVAFKRLLGGCQGLDCWDKGKTWPSMFQDSFYASCPMPGIHGHRGRGSALLAKPPPRPPSRLNGRPRNHRASLPPGASAPLDEVSTPTRGHPLSSRSPQTVPSLCPWHPQPLLRLGSLFQLPSTRTEVLKGCHQSHAPDPS